jgi:hypothetical protein
VQVPNKIIIRIGAICNCKMSERANICVLPWLRPAPCMCYTDLTQ